MSTSLNSSMTEPRHFHPDSTERIFAGLTLQGREGRRSFDRRLLLVLMLVEENIRRQLVISDLAKTVNLSPGRLAHLFKSEVGLSPQRYANNVRLEKAKKLLESGVLSVKEISSEIGFPNVSSFCRCFKARYNTTPGRYRKIHLRMDLKSITSFDYAV